MNNWELLIFIFVTPVLNPINTHRVLVSCDHKTRDHFPQQQFVHILCVSENTTYSQKIQTILGQVCLFVIFLLICKNLQNIKLANKTVFQFLFVRLNFVLFLCLYIWLYSIPSCIAQWGINIWELGRVSYVSLPLITWNHLKMLNHIEHRYVE